MPRIIAFGAYAARLRRRQTPRDATRRFWTEQLDRLAAYLAVLIRETDMQKKDLVIEAPAGELVWRAISQPEHLIRWWGPHRHANRILQFDWRVGGTWRIQTTTPEGQSIVFHGTYIEIEPEWKTVQTFGVEGMYGGAVSTDTLTLEEIDGVTHYRVVSVLPDVASRDDMLASGMETGVVEGFERLDAILFELAAPKP
jgi:uncharacterized protein YndB with AHSA1/START domain